MCVENAVLERQHSKEDQRKIDKQKMLTFTQHPQLVYSAHLALEFVLSSSGKEKITESYNKVGSMTRLICLLYTPEVTHHSLPYLTNNNENLNAFPVYHPNITNRPTS